MTIVRCTPEKQFKVLSFFFDGVPDSTKKTEVASVVKNDSLGVPIVTNIKPESYLHKPYAENKCISCHENEFSNRLIKPLPELCYTCHEDFGNKFQTLHGPVASGNCIACHNQHEAKYEKLLEREGQQLCLYCHEAKQVLKNKVHDKIGTRNCTECHNPHGGDNRGILNKGTCYNCHQNFESKYNFVHGPVVSGNCAGCHDSHGSSAPKLLLRESQQLCLFCHNAEQVFKNPAHKKVKTKNCIDCHNPHGGEDRYILIESLRPYITKPLVKTIIETKNDTLSQRKAVTGNEKDSVIKYPVTPIVSNVADNTKEKTKSDSVSNIKSNNVKDSVKSNPASLFIDNSTKTADNTKQTSSSVQQKSTDKLQENKASVDTSKRTVNNKSKTSNKVNPVKSTANNNAANKIKGNVNAGNQSKNNAAVTKGNNKTAVAPAAQKENHVEKEVSSGKKSEPSLKNADTVLKKIKAQIITDKANEKTHGEPKLIIPFAYKPKPKTEENNVGYAPDNLIVEPDNKNVKNNTLPLYKSVPKKETK